MSWRPTRTDGPDLTTCAGRGKRNKSDREVIDVGAFFGFAVSLVPLAVGATIFDVTVASPGLLFAALMLSSLAFAAFGLIFASIPTQSVGNIMMPSTLIRWPLLFIHQRHLCPLGGDGCLGAPAGLPFTPYLRSGLV